MAGGQPPIGLLGADQPVTRLAAAALTVLALGLAGCSGADAPSSTPAESSTVTSSSASPSPTPTTVIAVPPRPEDGACYRLDFDAAVAPTNDSRSVRCTRAHTAQTYEVGSLRRLLDGRSQAVDTRQVQARVARTCPRSFAAFVGGTADDRRLSMLRAVWFTPTLEEGGAGADWFRCDVIAVAGDGELGRLSGRLKGVLSTSAGRDRFGMCGTAEPGTTEFSRVICARPHSWRAIRTVSFATGGYPGTATVRDAGESPARRPRGTGQPTRSTSSGATSGPPPTSGRPGRRTVSAGHPTESLDRTGPLITGDR